MLIKSLLISVLLSSFFMTGCLCEAVDVAHEQFGPRAALKKYEWFIDQAKMIDKMDQDIVIFKGRISSMKEQYSTYGDDITKWPPSVQAQYNSQFRQANDDLAAVKSQRNNLVSEYNAASGKFNWKPFLTRPDKPQETYYILR